MNLNDLFNSGCENRAANLGEPIAPAEAFTFQTRNAPTFAV